MNMARRSLQGLLIFVCVIVSTCRQAHALPDSMAPYLYETYPGKVGKWFMNNPYAARLAGWYANHRIPGITAWHLNRFKKQINTSEIDPVELNAYRTFNDIFTRKLKSDARPIAHPENNTVVVSPADGALLIVPNLKPNTQFMVKGKSFNLARFFNDHAHAQAYIGGTMVIIYLSPTDYHRFHMPVTGNASNHVHINGAYESVYPSLFAHIQPLQENERHLLNIHTLDGINLAYFAVGAMFVGQIQYTASLGTHLRKGDELGYFSFGGSTIVLIFPPESFIPDDMHQAAVHHTPNNCQQFKKQWKQIKMGQAIGILNKRGIR